MSRDGSLPPGCSELSDLQKDVLLIDTNRKSRGFMPLAEAIKIADNEQVELVKIGESKRFHTYRLTERSAYQKHLDARKRLI